MSIIVGSARIDERGGISGGSAGDQTGREVSTQNFYLHSKGWYRLRPKKVEHANKLATSMKNACTNNNIGYDQSNRAAVNMVKKYGSTKAIVEKTETDCSNLVRACILEATGKDVGDFNTSSEADVLEKSGLFETRKSITSSDEVSNGDILVTKTKGHTVIVVDGRPRVNEASTGKAPNKSVRWNGKVTAVSLNVRSGAGVENKSIKIIKKGTVVGVCDEVKANNGTIWYYISIKGKYGFVSSKYIAKV